MKHKNVLSDKLKFSSVTTILLLGGCASINFDSNDKRGLVYYEPKPYLFYSQTKNCVSAVTVVTVPGKKKFMSFESGIGSSELSATFSNGIITGVGQASDSKMSETLSSIAAVAGAMAAEGGAVCSPVSVMFPIKDDGNPNLKEPINLLDWDQG